MSPVLNISDLTTKIVFPNAFTVFTDNRIGLQRGDMYWWQCQF